MGINLQFKSFSVREPSAERGSSALTNIPSSSEGSFQRLY